MRRFIPHLEILPSAQRGLWTEFGQVPREFTLYDGTAIVLHLGHRQSVDFDFFGSRPFDPAKLQVAIPFLKDAFVRQREENTLTAVVTREAQVAVSFFGVPNLPRLAAPLTSEDNGLRVASMLDLAGTKVSVVQLRSEAKDYLDLDALITKGGISLPMALTAGAASDDDFREALDHAPPGIIDPRSWAYWNSKMGRYPPPPLPVRRFGNVTGPDKMNFVQSHGIGSPGPALKGLSLEEERHNARVTWQNMRKGATTDLEEIRRQAREDWRAKYLGEDKSRK